MAAQLTLVMYLQVHETMVSRSASPLVPAEETTTTRSLEDFPEVVARMVQYQHSIASPYQHSANTQYTQSANTQYQPTGNTQYQPTGNTQYQPTGNIQHQTNPSTNQLQPSCSTSEYKPSSSTPYSGGAGGGMETLQDQV